MTINTYSSDSNQNYASPEEKLSLLSGLSLSQISRAARCKKADCCTGCYKRLMSLTNNVQGTEENQQAGHATLYASRAIKTI